MSDVKDYSQLKERLDQIVEAVSDEGISLDDALALYEEAVKLGSKASALIEEDISAKTAEDLAAALAAEQADADGAPSEQADADAAAAGATVAPTQAEGDAAASEAASAGQDVESVHGA